MLKLKKLSKLQMMKGTIVFLIVLIVPQFSAFQQQEAMNKALLNFSIISSNQKDFSRIRDINKKWL